MTTLCKTVRANHVGGAHRINWRLLNVEEGRERLKSVEKCPLKVQEGPGRNQGNGANVKIAEGRRRLNQLQEEGERNRGNRANQKVEEGRQGTSEKNAKGRYKGRETSRKRRNRVDQATWEVRSSRRTSRKGSRKIKKEIE
jgi:hypothetical protein